MFMFDPLYFILAAPGLLLALYASWKTKSTFNEYSQKISTYGLTGAEAAEKMLHNADVYDVTIEETQGFLSDHYDPTNKTLRLSPDVYRKNSLSAIGVACHEAGHALQHAEGYAPLKMRSSMVPLTNISSTLSYPLLFIGIFMASTNMILAGVVLFSVAVVFSLVTLPVEWDASARAKKLMVSTGVVPADEAYGAGKVLDAAFLTYVASAVSALLTLLYYLLRSGILGNRDD